MDDRPPVDALAYDAGAPMVRRPGGLDMGWVALRGWRSAAAGVHSQGLGRRSSTSSLVRTGSRASAISSGV